MSFRMLSRPNVQLTLGERVTRLNFFLKKKIRFMRPCKRHKQDANLAKHRKLIGRIPLQIDMAF